MSIPMGFKKREEKYYIALILNLYNMFKPI